MFRVSYFFIIPHFVRPSVHPSVADSKFFFLHTKLCTFLEVCSNAEHNVWSYDMGVGGLPSPIHVQQNIHDMFTTCSPHVPHMFTTCSNCSRQITFYAPMADDRPCSFNKLILISSMIIYSKHMCLLCRHIK